MVLHFCDKDLVTKNQTDGLSELEATVKTIYDFMKEHASSELGMCEIDDLESLLVEFNAQRLTGQIPCPHQNPG